MIAPRNQKGKATDWWFLYKTPKKTGRDSNDGFDFFYFDPDSGALELSSVGLNQNNQALGYTLETIFNAPKSTGYLVYNDEHVDQQSNQSDKGHCKGILAFDKTTDSALFLLHSTPRFPAKSECKLPEDETIYGQTFICITLPDYQTANQIAEQMLQQQNPQILSENSFLPANLQTDEPLYRLFHSNGEEAAKTPSTVRFSSKAGQPFLLIAKSRLWGEDFWLDLVSPELNCDLIVETWRRGATTPLKDKRSSVFDEDILSVKFAIGSTQTYQWSYTKDHSKWAVALKNDTSRRPWVCVADMNRMVSQEKRGGGSICFQQQELWQALKNAEDKLHQIASS